MSKRSNAAYYSQVERVYSHCEVCGKTGARHSNVDHKQLCKECRTAQRSQKVKRLIFEIAKGLNTGR
jgi:DnaJ-class molecular chaperone